MSQDTKLIPLTQGRFCIVDACDYEMLMQHKWYASSTDKKTWYANRTHNENGRKGKRFSVFMHRQILGLVGVKNICIDHIDNNGLNNSRSNLRVVTQSQNLQNSRMHTVNKTGFKGVTYECRSGNWYYRAKIKVNGKNMHLGYFKNKVDAAQAYNNAAIKHFNKYANLNIIPENTAY